jgi:hypothetical protein
MRRLAPLLLVLLVACVDDDDGAEKVGCGVTVDEASAAVGLPLTVADDVIESDGGTSCSWTYSNDESTATVDVTFFDRTGADALEDAEAAWTDRQDVPVEGADDALWSAESAGLLARVGEDAVRVFVTGPDVILDDPQGVAIVIARVALGEMELPGE